jgi:hypothetical protein
VYEKIGAEPISGSRAGLKVGCVENECAANGVGLELSVEGERRIPPRIGRLDSPKGVERMDQLACRVERNVEPRNADGVRADEIEERDPDRRPIIPADRQWGTLRAFESRGSALE